MTPHTLQKMLEEFLAATPVATVIESGQSVFELSAQGDGARYSITGEQGKCLLHLWSNERNAVRRVVDAELKNDVLRLSVQKFGQARPHVVEIARSGDRRTVAGKKSARAAYQALLKRLIYREFPGFTIEKMSQAMDLERSFGPAYTRCLLRKGRTAFAVLGVDENESQATVDAALTFGILWLQHCRESETRSAVEALKLLVPAGRAATLLARMAQLNHAAAGFHLYEVEQRSEVVTQAEVDAGGNIETRLLRCPGREGVLERLAGSVLRVRSLVPGVDAVVVSAGEVSFRLHGLEIARAQRGLQPGTFKQVDEIVFGAGANQTVLTEESEALFAGLMQRVLHARRNGGDARDPLWRMQPERWLESMVLKDVAAIDSRLQPAAVYSQVPAFSAADRVMIDVLACTKQGRIAVIELKADEDMHLPLQGLDYWSRVDWHHQRGEFQPLGYFPGRQLKQEPPLLFMAAPALRVHPTTDNILRYLSPKIEWTFAGLDERWRDGVRVVFRKQRAAGMAAQN